MSQKTYYYTDELHDDFAPSAGDKDIQKIDADYRYEHKNAFWKTLSFVLYRLIATPIAYVSLFLFRGMRIKNKKAIKKLKGGYFLYGNHTQTWGDAFAPTVVAFPKKVKIIVSPKAVSIPFVGKLVELLGGMPLPSNLGAMRNFMGAIKNSVNKGNVIAVYPEAHIWPYYNKIRDFSDVSFAYPWNMKVPTVAFVVTYRQRKLFKALPPLVTITLSRPFYAEDYESKKSLRDAVHKFMCDTVQMESSYAYRNYVKKT